MTGLSLAWPGLAWLVSAWRGLDYVGSSWVGLGYSALRCSVHLPWYFVFFLFCCSPARQEGNLLYFRRKRGAVTTLPTGIYPRIGRKHGRFLSACGLFCLLVASCRGEVHLSSQNFYYVREPCQVNTNEQSVKLNGRVLSRSPARKAPRHVHGMTNTEQQILNMRSSIFARIGAHTPFGLPTNDFRASKHGQCRSCADVAGSA